jgi:hypothetical protein
VDHPSGSARVWLDPTIELADNEGLTEPRVALVLRAVKKHEGELRNAWHQVHGKTPSSAGGQVGEFDRSGSRTRWPPWVEFDARP